METKERFTFEGAGEAQPVELVENGGSRTLQGYAVVWGAISTPKDGKRYYFEPKSIEFTPEVLALWHHDYGTPLASTGNGSLRIVQDAKGVAVEIDLLDTTAGSDTYANVKARLVRGMSFGGFILDAQPTADPNIYRVTRFIADEVTVTPRPAMIETSIEVVEAVELSKNSENDEKKTKDHLAEQRKLDRYKLAIYRGRVPG